MTQYRPKRGQCTTIHVFGGNPTPIPWGARRLLRQHGVWGEIAQRGEGGYRLERLAGLSRHGLSGGLSTISGRSSGSESGALSLIKGTD